MQSDQYDPVGGIPSECHSWCARHREYRQKILVLQLESILMLLFTLVSLTLIPNLFVPSWESYRYRIGYDWTLPPAAVPPLFIGRFWGRYSGLPSFTIFSSFVSRTSDDTRRRDGRVLRECSPSAISVRLLSGRYSVRPTRSRNFSTRLSSSWFCCSSRISSSIDADTDGFRRSHEATDQAISSWGLWGERGRLRRIDSRKPPPSFDPPFEY